MRGPRARGDGRGAIVSWRLVRALPLVAGLMSLASALQAQTVVEVLREQRREARVAEIMAELGPLVPARPPVELGTPDEHTLAYRAVIAAQTAEREAFLAAEAAKADSLIRVARMASFTWQRVPPDGQGAFLEQYREAFWRAAQPQRGLAIDSLSTQILRGRLQAAFGRPTRNADAERRHGYGGSEYIQFEYWFVVNDSIPVLVFDLDGPFGRGLLVASDERHADLMRRLKRGLSRRLAAATRRDPWLDYYHSFDRRQWYRVGFNGTEDFLVEVRPPRWRGQTDPDLWIIHR